MLNAPPLNIHTRYLNLQEMATRGTKNEAIIAQEKIDRLKKRYDFNLPPVAEEDRNDIFSKANNVQPAPKDEKRSLTVFAMKDIAIGNYVKWVLEEGFKIKGVWRHVDGTHASELFVEAKEVDLEYLRHISNVISERFKALWEHFSKTTGANPLDEDSFLFGLYDGLMREPRNPGHAMPRRSPKIKRKRGRKSTKASKPSNNDIGVRPHAYSVAVELGAKIRLNRPIGQITSLLEELVGLNAPS